MKLVIEQQQLASGLELVNGVVDKKHTIPALGCVKLEIDTTVGTMGALKLTGTNLEIAMTTTVSLVEGSGEPVLLPSQKLVEIVKELPKDSLILLETDDGFWATVTCGKSTFRLAGMNVTDFPAMALPQHPTYECKASVWKRRLERVAFGVSHDESRYTLTGALTIISQGGVRMVTADGHRLAQCGAIDGETVFSGILAQNLLTHLARVCKTMVDGELTTVYASDSQISLHVGRSVLSGRLIDGSFPDYSQVIPAASAVSVEVSKRALSEIVRRVMLMSGDNRMVKLTFDSATLTVSASDSQTGDATAIMPIATPVASPFVIGANGRYVLDVLGAVGGDTDVLSIKLNDPLSPLLITAQNEPDLAYVIMPMRVN